MLGVRLPSTMIRDLKIRAAKEGINVQAAVEKFIQQGLAK